jgi:hypothetical protein
MARTTAANRKARNVIDGVLNRTAAKITGFGSGLATLRSELHLLAEPGSR